MASPWEPVLGGSTEGSRPPPSFHLAASKTDSFVTQRREREVEEGPGAQRGFWTDPRPQAL